MTYPRQVVSYLLRFIKELPVIREMLPPASAADTEMAARRGDPRRRGRYHLQRHPFHVSLLLFRDPYINHIAGDHPRHEENHVIDLRDSITF